MCAAYNGHSSVSVDINPFLVWFGNAKVASYSEAETLQANSTATKVVSRLDDSSYSLAVLPNIYNIERWWKAEDLDFLGRLKAAIDDQTQGNEVSATLLNIAFCRTLIKLSNAAFNHQSMSFKNATDQQQCGDRNRAHPE